MRGRINGDVAHPARGHAGYGIYLAYPVHLVAEELYPYRAVSRIDREYLYRIPAHAEHVALKGEIVSLVAYLHELAHYLRHAARLSLAHGQHHAFIVYRIAETVYARYRGHNDHVAALEQRRRGRMAKPLDLVVYAHVLLDEGIRVRDIRLGLIIVVIGNEILHGIVGEKLPELAAELRGKSLVMRQHQRGPLQALYHLCHGISFSRARHAKQRLLGKSHFNSARQLFDSLRLVSGRGIFTYRPEFSHCFPSA